MMPLIQSTPSAADNWFSQIAGQCLLQHEAALLHEHLSQRPALPWLWLAPQPQSIPDNWPRGWQLCTSPQQRGHWQGLWQCQQDALPLPSAVFASIILQHPPGTPAQLAGLFDECARLLIEGGRLFLLALNPLSPYRMRWQRHAMACAEPFRWRRQLQKSGLTLDAITTGIGPVWLLHSAICAQHGAGLRAAFLLNAEKRRLPITPTRKRLRSPLSAPTLPAVSAQQPHSLTKFKHQNTLK